MFNMQSVPKCCLYVYIYMYTYTHACRYAFDEEKNVVVEEVTVNLEWVTSENMWRQIYIHAVCEVRKSDVKSEVPSFWAIHGLLAEYLCSINIICALCML